MQLNIMKNLFYFILLLCSIYSCQCQTKQTNLKFQKIEFSFDGHTDHPHYDLIIYADKTIIFNAKSNNFKNKLNGDIAPLGTNLEGENIKSTEIKGIFKSQLKGKDFIRIKSLINSLNDEFNQKNFNSEVLHNNVVLLKVKFKEDEVVNSIYDIGANGSETLKNLYKFLDELKFKIEWE